MEQVNTENSEATAPAGNIIPDREMLVELFTQLNTARKVGEFCSCEHPRFLAAAERAADIVDCLETSGEVSFSSSNGSISSGGNRVKPEEPYIDDLAAALRTAGINVLRLGNSVTAEGLADFISLLAAGTDPDAAAGRVRQSLSSLVTEGIRVGLSPPTGAPDEPTTVEPAVDASTWKAEIRRLLGDEPDERGYQEDACIGEPVILSDIDPCQLAELIGELDCIGSVDTVSRQFLAPYLCQAAAGRDGSEGFVSDRTRSRFLKLLRKLSPGHQIHFISAVFEVSHTFTRFAEDVLEAVPVHLADQAFAMIRTQENTIHPRITSRFEALCYLTGHTATAVHSVPIAPRKMDIEVSTDEGATLCTPLIEMEPAQVAGRPSSGEPARPARRLSLAADFTRAGKRRAVIRVVLDLLERSTSPNEARILSGKLPPLFTEALEERDWIGLSREWGELTRLVDQKRDAKPFLDKALRRIRKAFVTTQATDFIVNGIESSSEETAEVIRKWLPDLGPVAGESLVLALITSKSRIQRRNLLSAIVSFGETVVPLALKRINDHRWYVVRNMISIIREVGDKRAAEELLALSDHAQHQVLRELVNTLLALDHPAGMKLAATWIRSGDQKMRSACIGLLGTYHPDDARDVLLQVIQDKENGGVPFSQSQKENAVWALGKIGDGHVLPVLNSILKKNRMFRSPATHELKMAILRSLPEYPIESAEPLVRWGVNHGDEDEAAICSKLLSNILLTVERTRE